MTDFRRELELCTALAREAGALVMGYHGSALRVDTKPGNEPVSVADRASSQLIVSRLRSAYPADVIISEEAKDDPRRLTHPRVWYIDPIDGTKDFLRGSDGFCIMIGLAVGQRPVLGVVFQPIGDRLYTGAPEGAHASIGGAPPEPIRVSAVDQLDQLRLLASRSHRDASVDQIKVTLGITNELNVGSVGLKLGIIARGERDLYVNLSPRCKTWDTCAPEAILLAAGGAFTDVRGQPLRYDELESLHTTGLIASNGRIHDQIVAKLARLLPPA